jgi:hypothetical protein
MSIKLWIILGISGVLLLAFLVLLVIAWIVKVTRLDEIVSSFAGPGKEGDFGYGEKK